MASRLYKYLLSSWLNCTLSEEQVQNAVLKGYITQEEADTIKSTPRNCE